MSPMQYPIAITDDVVREERHARTIDMRGYRRSDGLFEVVGHLVDLKPDDYVAQVGQDREPDEPLHDMGVRLVLDTNLVVQDVQTFTNAAPFVPCPGGGASLKALVGLRIGAGWTSEVRKRLAPSETCTHLRELLIPMATVAIQSTVEARRGAPELLDADGRPRQIDSCFAYAANREVVLKRWPQFYRSTSGG